MILPRTERGRRVYDLVSRAGKILGTHTSRAKAERQEHAIQISRARAAGHRIPPPARARKARARTR